MPEYSHIVSSDLKAHIPLLHHEDHSIQQICQILSVKKSFIYKTLSLYSRYGTVTNQNKYSCATGHPQVLTSADIALIYTIIQYQSTIYLDKLQSELWAKHHKDITFSTLLQTLQRLSITQKIVSSSAAEQNEKTHAIYMNCIAAEAPDLNMLVFIDEAAKDKWTSTRQHGQLVRGVYCCIKRCFVCSARFSIIPTITLDGIITYNIIEGPVDGKCFLSFLKEHVMCRYYHDVSSHILSTHLCYRCHSPTCIPVFTVYSSWTIVASTMVRRSVCWSKTCIVHCQCIVLHVLTTNSLRTYFPPSLLSWLQPDRASLLCHQGVFSTPPWWLFNDHNCSHLSEHHLQQSRRLF